MLVGTPPKGRGLCSSFRGYVRVLVVRDSWVDDGVEQIGQELS